MDFLSKCFQKHPAATTYKIGESVKTFSMNTYVYTIVMLSLSIIMSYRLISTTAANLLNKEYKHLREKNYSVQVFAQTRMHLLFLTITVQWEGYVIRSDRGVKRRDGDIKPTSFNILNPIILTEATEIRIFNLFRESKLFYSIISYIFRKYVK